MELPHDADSPWTVLIVEDDAEETARLRENVARPPMGSVVVDAVGTLAAGLRRLTTRGYDAVLVALGLPDSCGLYTFDAVSAAAPHSAIVVLVDPDGDRVAAEAARRGAQAHLIRGDRRTGAIAATVLHAIRRQHVLDELHAARDAQLAEKDRFLSHVSHELRSPLALVQQSARRLADGSAGPLTAEQGRLVQALIRDAEHLAVMIDDLLRVVRSRRGALALEPTVVDPTAVVADVLAGYRPAAVRRRVALSFEPAPVPEVTADPQRLREIVGNVVDNAMKFTPPGGRITVTMDSDGPAVRITVRDTGPGVPAGDLPHIFEMFFQGEPRAGARRDGLGLGLAICRDLVERQGGQIAAQSEPGRGTAVSFTLPVEPAGAGAATAQVATCPQPAGRGAAATQVAVRPQPDEKAAATTQIAAAPLSLTS